MTYTESDLIIPVLNYLFVNKENGLTTTQLIELLLSDLEVAGRDAEIIPNRQDTYFSQKVRNLVSSHKTLQAKGLATYTNIRGNGLHKITEIGEKYLFENIDNFTFIFDSNFSDDDRERVINGDYLNLVIEEGYSKVTEGKTRVRSRKLTEIAKKIFSREDGKIFCSVCDFNFENFYGELGKGYIEIHHISPIFAYESNFEQGVQEAINNLTPVCSNCHRMLHRKKDLLLSIPSLREVIEFNRP